MNNRSYLNPGIKWGLIAGLVAVIVSVIMWVTNREMFFSITLGFIMLCLFIIFSVLAGLDKKRQLGGYISFKQALQPVFLTFVIGALIVTIYNYITYNFIDPTAADQMKQYTVATLEKMLYRLGMPEDQLEEQLDSIRQQDFHMGPAQSFLNYLSLLIRYFIVAAIVSLAIRKKGPVHPAGINEIGKHS